MPTDPRADNWDFQELWAWLRHKASSLLAGARHLRRRIDSSDLTQEACLRALACQKELVGMTEGQQKAYLTRALGSAFVDAERKAFRKRRNIGRERPLQAQPGSSTGPNNEPAAVQATPSEVVDAREKWVRLDWALDQLPQQERDVFILRRLAGYSIDAVAEFLDMSRGTVGNRLDSALEQLKQLLGEFQ
jgi:RNA polymerase sigma-70 factor (ECF subfamily)